MTEKAGVDRGPNGGAGSVQGPSGGEVAWNSTVDALFSVQDPRFWKNYKIDIEQLFPVDPPKTSGETCRAWLRGNCTRGENCQYLHKRGHTTSVVCKHWLRGLCKKDQTCEFLHEFRPEKMPMCFFFSKFNECNNPECLYLHVTNTERGKECHYYLGGFCKMGTECRNVHTCRPSPCQYYLAGFCPDGPNCKFGHPKYDGEYLLMNSNSSSSYQ